MVTNCVRDEFQPCRRPFDEEAPVVLQVGTGPNKNVERVAAALVGTPCRLHIVGRLDDQQRRAIGATGVSFNELGFLSDAALVSEYKVADLIVFASLYEGFGLPIPDAQATGRPVITSERCSMPEVAGGGATFVDPEDIGSIRQAVKRLVNDGTLRARCVEAGFENVRNYTAEVVARRYEAVYDRVQGTSRATLESACRDGR